MGNCTVTIKKRDTGIGDHVEVTADVAMSTSYATGGDTLKLSDLGLKTLRALVLCSSIAPATTRPLAVVHGSTEVVDPKIMVMVVATGIEETSTTNVATSIVRVVAKGDHAFA